MPRLSKPQLLQKVIQAVRASGCTARVISRDHPFRLIVSDGSRSWRIRVYIWNLTYGGAPRSENELRIQVTGLSSQHFEVTDNEKTLILGWHEPTGVFAGFDIQKHLGNLGYSPSIQIHRDVVLSAEQRGIATQDKGNDEIAIAIREDFMGEYIQNVETLHGFAQSASDLSELDEAIENPEINEDEVQIGDQQRRTVITTLSHYIRDANFRRKVIRAYGNRCAVCGTQLGIVQAAHIIPVAHESSTDDTSNGIALCCNHHAAFDDGLIAIQEDYRIYVNPLRVQELESLGLTEGLENFVRDLREEIYYPDDVHDRPHREYIRIGNEVRGIRVA